MPKVSVIIPVYNEEENIQACLQSLNKQTYQNLEVIIVDDGSSDSTVDKVQEFSRAKLLSQKHKGAGAARNLGATKAGGEILVFVDADMTFTPDFIKKLVAPIIRKKTIGTFSKEEYLANKDNFWAKAWNINRGLSGERMLPKDYPDSQKVFRAILKKEFEKAGGFDEKAGYTDDWSLSQKLGVEALAAKGAKFYHKNPDSLKEVFIQARWVAKRRYKLGFIGTIVALIRVSLPMSIILGLLKSIFCFMPGFLFFKIISDFAEFIGIFEFAFAGKVAK